MTGLFNCPLKMHFISLEVLICYGVTKGSSIHSPDTALIKRYIDFE